MDRAAVILGVDDRRRLAREAREIGLHRHAAGQLDIAEMRLQRHDGRDAAGANDLRGDLEDAPVQLLGEMLRPQKIRDAIEGVVVDENGAEQRLLGLDIVGRRAIGGLVEHFSLGNGT